MEFNIGSSLIYQNMNESPKFTFLTFEKQKTSLFFSFEQNYFPIYIFQKELSSSEKNKIKIAFKKHFFVDPIPNTNIVYFEKYKKGVEIFFNENMKEIH